MANIVFITGGARSGKSSYAQKEASNQSENPVYLATAKIWDEEFAQRVERHKADRGPEWTTIEEEIYISKTALSQQVIVLDCVTLWLTNIFERFQYNVLRSLEFAQKEWDAFTKPENTLFVVSNEIGMGVIPQNDAARKFADLQGWMNQHIAASAQEVILMISGCPLTVKTKTQHDYSRTNTE